MIVFLYFFLFFKSIEATEIPQGGFFSYHSLSNEKTVNQNTQDFLRKNLVLVFGFTKCKSICPLTLSQLNSAYLKMSLAEQKKTEILFISVDTERDTLKLLQSYVTKFNPQFQFGTATEKELHKILKMFGARFYTYKTDSGSILVDHSTDIYFINQQGQWTHQLPFDATADEIKLALEKSNQTQNKYFQKFIDEEIQWVKSKSQKKNICNTQKNECKFIFENIEYLLKIENPPMTSNKKMKFVLSTKAEVNPKEKIFFELEGKEVYMGYLRSDFLKKENKLIAEIDIPACDLERMNWSFNVVFNKNMSNKGIKLKYNDK